MATRTRPRKPRTPARSPALTFLDRLCSLIEHGTADDVDARVAVLSDLVRKLAEHDSSPDVRDAAEHMLLRMTK